ncbi:ABC transporter substrate-binding protein [Emergencia timonensis]|uniref:ABC transporter substrate-binding protein n=1 Tax=Emergencia timonensis TaxID=1776384 RepID=UPI000831D8A8|nr:ABC transporter substrate-binding protein [Emergencia timonensis]WNX90143.1 ABC transporter substrate-binding protein [Emergencia timonensis]
MKKKFLVSLLCICALVTGLLLTGCGSSEDGESKGGDTLVYGSQDYTAINPALYEHGEINALLFAGLTAHDEDNKVVPALAESWKFDEESLTYTFQLREGLTFHDGEALTSADVKFTLEAILDEDNQSEIISNYTDIDKITCPDDLTVKIKLKQVNVAFPDYMSIGILPKHLLEGEDLATCDFNQNPVGAGPYKMKEWDTAQSITMEKFDGYYNGEPNIGTVVFKIVPDTDAKAMQLKSGDIDMAQITAKTAKDIEETGDYNIFRMDTADYRAIAYNFGSALFKKYPELANILSYAIDRETIIKSVLLGEGQAAYSPIQKGEYNNEKIEKFSYDPEECQRLLEEDGWKKNSDGFYEKDGTELKFVISAMSDDQVRVDMAKLCANQLQKIGVNASAESKPSLDWAGQDCCIIGWGSPFDADDHTYKVFSTDAGDNYTGYSNQKIDQLLKDARHTENQEKRKALYQEFQEEMTKAMPYTFIAYVDADYAIKKNITGITEKTVLGHHGVGVFWNIADWKIEG